MVSEKEKKKSGSEKEARTAWLLPKKKVKQWGLFSSLSFFGVFRERRKRRSFLCLFNFCVVSVEVLGCDVMTFRQFLCSSFQVSVGLFCCVCFVCLGCVVVVVGFFWGAGGGGGGARAGTVSDSADTEFSARLRHFGRI